tara:strand:- start:790 stop:1839 length:1050 start_codon:yes stop_codon:yes gene_type:complete
MAVGSLAPGILYFLELEPIDSYGPFPFYKLGYTKDDVKDRINQLKTGNPFTIIAKDFFHSEAAGHIELKLHRKYQKNNQNLEWFRFDSEAEINEVIQQARMWDAELKDVVTTVRELDIVVSNGETIEATDAVKELAEEYKAKDKQRQVAVREQDEHKQIIIAEALKQGAVITGSLTAKVATAGISYDWDAIQTQYADQWAECLRGKKIKNPSAFHTDYRINAREVPESDEAKDRRLDNKSKLEEMLDVFADEEVKEVDPNETVLASQEVLAKKKRQLDYLKYEMLELKMKVALACGENNAINGVFNWERTEVDDIEGQKRQFRRSHKDLLIQKPVAEDSKVGSVTLRVI